MSTRLHAVPDRPISNPAHWFWSGSNPADAPPPRVLCAEVVRRLADLNAAVRTLRALGVRIVSQDIDGAFPADGEPLIRIEHDKARPFAPVLDAVGSRSYRVCGTTTIGFGRINGVVVVWEDER